MMSYTSSTQTRVYLVVLLISSKDGEGIWCKAVGQEARFFEDSCISFHSENESNRRRQILRCKEISVFFIPASCQLQLISRLGVLGVLLLLGVDRESLKTITIQRSDEKSNVNGPNTNFKFSFIYI